MAPTTRRTARRAAAVPVAVPAASASLADLPDDLLLKILKRITLPERYGLHSLL